MKKHGFTIAKPKWKPGLTDIARQQRLAFALDHQDWVLENWKGDIWTDETSVILGHRRGAVRVWRKPEDAGDLTCTRRRWKGYSEFMFWGSFSYDKKGPCHIWLPESAQDKKIAEKELALINQRNEAACREEWELTTGLQRMKLRNPRGRKLQWKFTKKTGKLVRDGKGGIDWYRYQKVSIFMDFHGFFSWILWIL